MYDTQTFYVNSRNRITGSDSNFSIILEISPSSDYTHCCLLSASIPKSFYAINEGRNSFTLIEDDVSIIITVKPGNYSRQSFALILQSLLRLNSINGLLYTISYPNINRECDDGKYKFSVSGNIGYQPIILLNDYLYEPMGFNKISSNQFVDGLLFSTNVSNQNPEATLILHSDLVTGHNSHLKSLMTTTTNSFDYIIFQNNTISETSKHMNMSKSNVYNFQLTDEAGIELPLNGLNMVFVVLVYRKEN
jgi:hypothetical protein